MENGVVELVADRHLSLTQLVWDEHFLAVRHLNHKSLLVEVNFLDGNLDVSEVAKTGNGTACHSFDDLQLLDELLPFLEYVVISHHIRERLLRIHPKLVYFCLLENVNATALVSDRFNLREYVILHDLHLVVEVAGIVVVIYINDLLIGQYIVIV